jgi:hypothetical protein
MSQESKKAVSLEGIGSHGHEQPSKRGETSGVNQKELLAEFARLDAMRQVQERDGSDQADATGDLSKYTSRAESRLHSKTATSAIRLQARRTRMEGGNEPSLPHF